MSSLAALSSPGKVRLMCSFTAKARQGYAIRGEIEQQYQAAEHNLRSARQSGGIKQRPNVVLDETAAVTSAAALHAQRIFQRRKRTNPTHVLDQYAPHCSGNVKKCHPRPAQNQQSSQNDKEDKREMQYEYEVR